MVYTLGSDCTTLGSSSTVQQIQGATVQGLTSGISKYVGDVSIISTSNSCTGSGRRRHLLFSRRGLHSDDNSTVIITSVPQLLQTTYGTLAMTTQIQWPKGSKIQTAYDVSQRSFC